MGRIALVTGANQGLGFALVEGLARELGPDDVVYLTGRDDRRVAAARDRVSGARADVRTHLLDVRDGAAVTAFAERLRAEHGGVDIVLSNHYLRTVPEDVPADVIGAYVDANNLGTTRMLRAFLPLLRPRGRFVVVASSLGRLRELPVALHARFEQAATLDDIDAITVAWRDAVIDGRARDEGWPEFINIASKVAQVAAVRVVARGRRADDLAKDRLVVAACPGMIDTASSRPWFDMTGAQSAPEAAVALLRLVLDPETDPARYGELVRFGKVLRWP
ncbi:SDR family NAD(P)-dependent oxidoreductase [Amorphoplanes digitatis]|uniref:NAD(P)-dependent dehydrogenase (Short-subunit alcohol dehydrogenase family) n=1 Tax=Actinoplanes digitatis TaxID=1868 RepID=A0A7W7I3J3_9ACTN|nr:SDR family NAD(P)-dependent oxidoreductase [Actinoplanes digitatis]MBB4765777.1 NAD(P)-dependent dehydrogenase (short-subunit alcohol dehydrogenase family) [Actinoplanes digitatis]BFE75686.1 SDR family NAD(P)-dependent oxidoreductase [Actinoplanes digitatis]GID93432.1 carbonyl reductase [Actinoplanes digitatis]